MHPSVVSADPDVTRQVYERVANPDKSLTIYPGLYHEIFNELSRLAVLADVETWITKHL